MFANTPNLRINPPFLRGRGIHEGRESGNKRNFLGGGAGQKKIPPKKPLGGLLRTPFWKIGKKF